MILLGLRKLKCRIYLTKQNISLHINNIFKENELTKSATVKESLTVRKDGTRTVKRKLDFYSLDVIISVGYRAKSQRGTQFRIWANQVLKEYLLKRYSINKEQVKRKQQQPTHLKNTANLLSNTLEIKVLNIDEATRRLRVVTNYVYALDILDKYDHQRLTIEGTTTKQRQFLNNSVI